MQILSKMTLIPEGKDIPPGANEVRSEKENSYIMIMSRSRARMEASFNKLNRAKDKLPREKDLAKKKWQRKIKKSMTPLKSFISRITGNSNSLSHSHSSTGPLAQETGRT
jgi:hypothetical protein